MKKNQVVIAMLGLLVCVAAVGFIYWYMNNGLDYSAIEQIESVQKGPNHFQDLAGTVNVESADDIGYQIKDEMYLNILYGDLVIKVPPAAFESEEFMSRLKKVGIEIQYRTNPDTGKLQYRVTYWGTPVDCYAIVN